MSDAYLLKKFLDRSYNISLVNREREAGEVSLVSLKGNEYVNKEKLERELSKIFGNGSHIKKIFEEWYSHHIKTVIQEFTAFLDECELVQGHSNWELRHAIHGRIKVDKLETYYYGNENPHHNTLKSIYDVWYDNKIIEASEKIMRLW